MITNKARSLILELLLHESHLSVKKSTNRAKNIFYWPGMLNDVEQCTMNCRTCKLFRSVNEKNKPVPHTITKLPFEKVAVDK